MVNPESDFLNVDEQDVKLRGLHDAIMSTDIGRDRKSILTMEQAMAIARARAFADSFIEWQYDNDGDIVRDSDNKPVMVEGPLELVHTICDYLEDTAVSTGKGTGLKMIEKIFSAQLSGGEEDTEVDRLRSKVMN